MFIQYSNQQLGKKNLDNELKIFDATSTKVRTPVGWTARRWRMHTL